MIRGEKPPGWTKVKNRKHRPWRIGDATTKDHSGRNAPAVAR
jgi:hypothetical protein